MKIPYYPGCTLKTKAKNLEDSAIAAAKVLDIEMEELPRWNCCGTVYSLSSDDLIHQIGSIRNLIRVKEQGDNRVVTLCSMCYNTLKRANEFFLADEEKQARINRYMDEEIDYSGDVRVVHLLEILRDEIGIDKIKAAVKKPLAGLKVAPYYGCMLLRPASIGIDDVERPVVMEEILRALGAEIIDDPYKTECCGAYQTVNRKDVVVTCVHSILTSAQQNGAEVIALSCPLCDFNLDNRQKDIREVYNGFHNIPVLYFTQLMAIAFGLDESVCRFELSAQDPRPLLKAKGLIG
jgi:heterodisulfide reductase subunit B